MTDKNMKDAKIERLQAELDAASAVNANLKKENIYLEEKITQYANEKRQLNAAIDNAIRHLEYVKK